MTQLISSLSNIAVGFFGCPSCAEAFSERQAAAMRLSIFLLLILVYSLAGVIAFKVVRMMAREDQKLKDQAQASLATPHVS